VGMKITRKLCARTLVKVNNHKILEKRKLYVTNFLTNSPENDNKIIFIDESGFNLHLKPSFGRSHIGKGSSVSVSCCLEKVVLHLEKSGNRIINSLNMVQNSIKDIIKTIDFK